MQKLPTFNLQDVLYQTNLFKKDWSVSKRGKADATNEEI